MIDIKTIGTWGFEGAIRGMRMPFESFDKSDSGLVADCNSSCPYYTTMECDSTLVDKDSLCPTKHYSIGKADMALCKKLIKGGSEHRKFLRMIHVQAEVKAPRYWWAEMDKYKWVEANSSSTMHLITKKELSIDDFSIDYNPETCLPYERLKIAVDNLCDAIEEYKRDKAEGCDKYILDMDFRIIKEVLPESYNQLRTIDTNYECLLNIYRQRKNHRLSEWSGGNGFCSWIRTLPHMDEFLEVTND